MPRGYFSPRENPQAGEFTYVFGGQDGGYQRGCGAVWIIIQVMPGCGLGHKLAYALVESASDIPSRPSSPNRTSA
jgi:hypothetical protein